MIHKSIQRSIRECALYTRRLLYTTSRFTASVALHNFVLHTRSFCFTDQSLYESVRSGVSLCTLNTFLHSSSRCQSPHHHDTPTSTYTNPHSAMCTRVVGLTLNNGSSQVSHLALDSVLFVPNSVDIGGFRCSPRGLPGKWRHATGLQPTSNRNVQRFRGELVFNAQRLCV